MAPTQACGRVGGKRAGFALLAVIWGLGVIAMLVVAFLDAGRLRLQTAVNVAAATQAAYVAESAVNRAILALLAGRDRRTPTAETIYDGAPEFCMLDGAAVALGVADEGGKIDLNAAPPELLLAALRALGIDERNAQDATRGIIAFRTAPSGDPGLFGESPAGDKPTPPKQGLFETVMELDQASGVDPALFRLLLPFVTIHSKAAGVDARASPPALFAALSGYPAAEVKALAATPYPNRLNRADPRFPARFNQAGVQSAFLIHAEARLATGQTIAKDALVDLRPPSGKPFAIVEFRRGPSQYAAPLRAMLEANGAGVPAC